MIDDVAEQLYAGIYGMVSIAGVGRVAIGGEIVQLGERFLKRLQALAGCTAGQHILRGITICYSHQDVGSVSRGLVSYFIRKRFEISRGKA